MLSLFLAIDPGNETAIFIGFNGDGFLGTRLERKLDGEGGVAAVEVLLPVKGQFKLGAGLDHPGREYGLHGRSQGLGCFLGHATVGQFVDQTAALGDLEGFVNWFGRRRFGDDGNVAGFGFGGLNFGIQHNGLAVAIGQITRSLFPDSCCRRRDHARE